MNVLAYCVLSLGIAAAACSEQNGGSSRAAREDPIATSFSATPPAPNPAASRRGEPENKTVAPSPNPRNGAATGIQTVPERFVGLFAVDRKACAQDYSYNPAFQNVTVNVRSVSFFETGGPVTAVDVSGNMIAITLRERVGDGEFKRAIYFALNPDGSVRYRPGRSEPSRTYVRCGAD